jgi:5'-3' exoribonuclease 2
VSVLRRLIHALAPQTPPRLWESGYRERYYQQKFAVEYTDQEFKKKYDILFVIIDARFILHPCRITTHYVEGLAWVLAYYYQGVRLYLHPYYFTVTDI